MEGRLGKAEGNDVSVSVVDERFCGPSCGRHAHRAASLITLSLA